jgi:hypothetical protein
MKVSGNFKPRPLTPGKERLYPFNRRLCEPQGLDVLVRENRLPLPGFEPRTAQSVAIPYTKYATPTPIE